MTMTTNSDRPGSVAEQIPDPETVRSQLSENLREGRLLRQLLRVSERKAKDQKLRAEGSR
jgi:hypothetical protein